MAGATQRIIAGAAWSKLIAADNRDCLVLIDAWGAIEIAVSESKLLDPSVTRGHPTNGTIWLRIQGRDAVWAKGAGTPVYATALKFIPTFNGQASSSGGQPVEPSPLQAIDASGALVSLTDAAGNLVTITED